MNDHEIAEAFQTLREHLNPAAVPLLDNLERLYEIDRALLQAKRLQIGLIEDLVGHRVYDDNMRHSRRVGVRAVPS